MKIPMNFLKTKADYVNTGEWASKALKEAKWVGEAIEVASSKEGIVVKYELKQLPYAFNALEPYLDARTVEIHRKE